MTPVCLDDLPVSKEVSDICEYLDWDSGLFGIRIGKVAGNHLDEERATKVLQWSRHYAVDCLYFLADVDGPTMRVAEQHGFRLVDIRSTLEARLLGSYSAKWGQDGVREAVPGDIPAVREIAAQSHTDTRFYRDGRFDRHQCDELYRIWIEKSCRGYADMVMVAEHDSRPVGYISCHLKGDGSGQIGLVGVDGSVRGLGIGQKLVRQALYWFVEQEAHDVSVVTQGNNVRAQRLYQRSGFLARSVQLWYHLWPASAREAMRGC